MKKIAKYVALFPVIAVLTTNIGCSQSVSVEDIVVNMTTVDPEDIVENLSFPKTVSITFSGNSVAISDLPSGVKVDSDGSRVTVDAGTDGVEIILSGTSNNGSLSIDASNKLKLSLNGVTLTNNDGPAINILSGKRTFVVSGSGTNNTLADRAEYSAENQTAKGTLFSEGELIFSGKGRLSVSSSYNHAICSDDYVVIREGTISIPNSGKDGIHANSFILVDDGNITMDVESDGIECEKGGIRINGGNIEIISTKDKSAAIISETSITVSGGKIVASVNGKGSKGIRGKESVTISSGSIDITTVGDALQEEQDITSSAGVSSNGNIDISGSKTFLKITSSGSAGKGISCDGDMNISNGNITITTSGAPFYGGTTSYASQQYSGRSGRGGSGGLSSTAKGIKAEGNLNISNGNITVTTSEGSTSEAIESKKRITISGGTIIAYADDDALNASEFIINGGKIFSYSNRNDGIDSNGPITIKDGLIVTAAPRGGMEGGIDCDRYPLAIEGGTLISFGGSGSSPSASVSTQPSIIFYGNITQNIHIVSQDNSEIITVTLPMQTSESLTFSTPLLRTNSTYTIYTGGTIAGGTKSDLGIYNGSSFSNGTELATITLSTVVNFAGSSNNMGGFGGRRR